MRISDWSSDVCSSDLLIEQPPTGSASSQIGNMNMTPITFVQCSAIEEQSRSSGQVQSQAPNPIGRTPLLRSEEHTSELQSLMRISYAVFCLKKKKTNVTTNN